MANHCSRGWECKENDVDCNADFETSGNLAVFTVSKQYSQRLNRTMIMKRITDAVLGLEKAAHLLQRAGFGGSPDEVRAWAAKSPDAAVAELVGFGSGSDDDFGPPVFLETSAESDANFAKEFANLRNLRREDQAAAEQAQRRLNAQRRRVQYQGIGELRAWWLYRMRYSNAPLQEKMTLFLHGHFASATQKVRSPGMLYQQNQLFRRLGNGNWEDLVNGVASDPAMLLYLDNARSNRRKPNENFARELLELFTLGEGNYTEEDILAAARAYTGYSIERETGEFVFRNFMHDPGRKTFMGETGAFKGEDIVRIVLKHEQAPRFLTAKLWRFFVGSDASEAQVDHLSRVLLDAKWELKPLLSEIFLSEDFYDEKVRRGLIKSPTQWFVQLLKSMEAPLPDPRISNGILIQLGQELFNPPNVKGWDGGAAWINSSTLLNRYNFAGALVRGKLPQNLGRSPTNRRSYNNRPNLRSVVDPERVLPPADRKDRASVQRALFARLYQSQLRATDRAKFMEYLDTQKDPADWNERDLQEAVHLLLSSPQYQLA